MALRKYNKEQDLRYADHVVTVFTWVDEDSQGVAQWIRTVVKNCSIVKRQGVHTLLTRTLEVPFDKGHLYFFLDTANASNTWVNEQEFFALSDKTGYFTIRSDGKDRIIEGKYDGLGPPPDQNPVVFKPNLVVDNTRMGSFDMQHIRIVLG